MAALQQHAGTAPGNLESYGFLGTADVSIWLSLGVTAALAGAAVAWSSWLFATGRRLKA